MFVFPRNDIQSLLPKAAAAWQQQIDVRFVYIYPSREVFSIIFICFIHIQEQ